MATSPNFSWPEPDNTDLVKNGALAIRTAVDAIDSSMVDLKGGTTGQVLKKNSNTDMDFIWSADSAGMTNPMTTTGDTIYSSSGSTPARLGIGSTGQVLTVSGGVPTWASPAGGGKVLQVVQGTAATTATIASTSFTDTGLSVSITPSSASSKVLILVMQQYVAYRAYQYAGMNIQLVRGSTAVFDSDVAGSSLYEMGTSSASQDNNLSGYANFSYLDSPATTSAQTYKMQMRVNTTANSGSVSTSNSVVSTIIAMEIGA